VVESALVDDLYEKPQHPYTIGLLKAIPRLDETGEAGAAELASIEGVPPDLLRELTFCPFAPRCNYAFDRCWAEVPPSIKVGLQHSAACFYDVRKGEPRNDL